jgi:serine/threonine-protein kinase
MKVGPRGIPINDALSIARQIAEALAAAHEHGIIHRDLKPANIALTAEGQVKVLDFGLAKALGPGGEGRAVDSPALTQSPTLSLAATQAGMILGTAAYMAPEQAKGRPVDKRSDIWAFGCVLYEMVAGKRAFEGEGAAETLAFVMAREPDWSVLPADVPAAIRILLRRCLEKDRRRCLADVAAALVLIEEAPRLTGLQDQAAIQQEGEALRQQIDAAVSTARPDLARSTRWRVVGISMGACGVVGLIAVIATWLLTRPALPSVVRTTVTTSGSTALTLSGFSRDLAITPDGSRVVYRGNNQLLVRALNQLEPTVLSGLGAPEGVFVSPDGQWAGFFDGTTIKKVAITGGPPVTVCAVDGFSRGATWSAEGTIIFATHSPATGLQRVFAAGGDPAVLTKPDRDRGEGDHVWPRVPAGRRRGPLHDCSGQRGAPPALPWSPELAEQLSNR